MLVKSDPHDEAEIKSVINALSKALHDKNAEGVVALYTDDTVMFSLAPPLVLRTDGDLDGLNEWFGTWLGPINVEHRDAVIETGGDIAIVRGLARMTGTKTDGQDVELWFRKTTGFRRTDGGWKISHEHESVPFYMDGSFKAAIDLKP
jgi:PhnB protein